MKCPKCGYLGFEDVGRCRNCGSDWSRTADADSDVIVGGSPVGIAAAALCFLIVLAAIVWGIYKVYQLGHPH